MCQIALVGFNFRQNQDSTLIKFFKSIKKLAKILTITFAALLFTLGTLIAFINSKDVQQYLVEKSTAILSEKLHAKVQIEAVDIELFNKLSLKGVYMADQKGDTLLFAKKLNLGIQPLYLFQNKLVFNSISISKLRARLVVDKKNVFNLKFLLDKLSSKDTTAMKVAFRIDDIKLEEAKISFDNLNFERKALGFDAKHILLSDVNARIKLEQLNSQYLSATLKEFNFHEKSGFALKNIELAIQANKRMARIENFKIELPHSEVSFTPIVAKYGSLKNLKHIEDVKLEFSLNQSIIRLSDLKAFVPGLAKTKGNIKLSTKFRGSLSNMRIKNFNFAYNDNLYLNGDFEFSGLPKLSETFVYAKINEIKTDKSKLQDLLSNIIGRPIMLPEKLSRLGIIRYKGNISGFPSNLVAYGTWKTSIGLVSTDLMLEMSNDFKQLNYSGSVKANELKVGNMLSDSSALGNISFNFSSKGNIAQKGQIMGDVKGNISSVTYKNYTYNNIKIEGKFDKKSFDGKVNFDDENAKLAFDGGISFDNKLPSGQFALRVDKFNPSKLNLTSKENDVTFAFSAKADFIGKDIEKTNTNLLIDSINIYNPKHEVFIRRIHIKSTIGDTVSILTVNSELMKGVLKGRYNLLTLGSNLKNFLQNYLPSTIEKSATTTTKSVNNFVFRFSDFHINDIAEVLNLNLELSSQSTLAGFYNNHDNKMHLELNIPKVRWKNNTYTDTYLMCSNPDYALHLSSKTMINDQMKVSLDSRVAKDSVIMSLGWDSPTFFSGGLNILNIMSRNYDKKLQADMDIFPSKIWLKNIAWNVKKSKLHTDFKKLYVQDFELEHDNHYVKIDGVASKEISDGVNVQIQQVELSNILNMVGLRKIRLDGLITGNATLMSVFDKFILNIDAETKDFSFNNFIWGDVKVKSTWDNTRKKLNAQCLAFSPTDTIVNMRGEYFPKNDSLEFYADAKKLNIKFLRNYLDGALQNVDGEGTGRMHFFGGLKNFLMEGDIAVNNGRFNVDFLKTAYHFTDTVHIRKGELRFRNIRVYDEENNSGVVNGWLTHKVFKNMRFNFNINCKNILGINTTQKDNESFYGKAYGTGLVRISGDANKVDFNINVKTEPKSKLTIPMVTSAVATENTFIKFKPKIDKNAEIISKKKEEATTSKTHITLKLQLEATPDAEVQLIIDPVGGDMVRASGNGNLRIEFDNFAGLKLYGNYEAEKGEYVFTLQQVIRKNFSIRRGGTIRWSGNPYIALINMNAVYTVPSVSLLDILDDAQMESVARSSVPVNCLLNLTGDLLQPNIKFDLEIPTDAETQRRIKNIVNTEEMMNREILALLVMNRFYKPDYLQSNRSGLGTEMVSVLTTTVSGQLNNWLSQLSNKVNVGVNARLGNGENFSEGGEYEVALMYQPNNRLVISSNVGYRNDLMNTTGTNFIGDVDVEYKLSRSGKLRAKAYTHSADNYYYTTSSSAKTTQGVGFIYREDFNSFRDFVSHYFDSKIKNNDSTRVDKQNINSTK